MTILFSTLSLYLYLFVIILSFAFALTYLLRNKFMPYHAKALEQKWHELDKKNQILFIALMKVCGGGWLATGFALLILVLFPFINGDAWAGWAIPVIGLSTVVPSLIATLLVKKHTPASPPVWAAMTAIIFLLVGYFCDH